MTGIRPADHQFTYRKEGSMAGTRKAPAKKTAAKKTTTRKKAEPVLELKDDGFWWYGDTNLGRSRRYAENWVANQ